MATGLPTYRTPPPLPANPPPLAPATAPTFTPAAVAAPAVEVVTSLGSSVVSVDTLRTPTAGRNRSYLFAGIGAALLTASAITFGSGVWAAQRDAERLARWTHEGRPTWAFRPTRHSQGADVLSLGGALTGLGLVAMALLQKKDKARTSLRVGQTDGVDVPLADAPELTLVSADGRGGFVANLTGLTGDVRQGGATLSIAALAAAGHTTIPLATDTHVRAQLGRTTFHLKGMEAPAASAAPALWSAESRALAFIAASAVAHLGVLAILRMVPPQENTGSGDIKDGEEIGVVARINSNEEMPAERKPDDGDDGTTGGAMSQVVSMALEDGTLGSPDGNPNPAQLKVMNRGGDPELARREAIQMATEAGILSSFQSPIAVFNGGDIASGFDDVDITGGIFDGGGNGGPVGSFGWGVKGFGQGCGRGDGKPCQGIQAGPFATTGWKGDHDYLGPLDHPGDGPDGHRHPKVPPIVELKPTTCTANNPCLDEQIIRRYVHRNIEKITYCYESVLIGKPGLEGTVTALFTLDANGTVVESHASGVDPEVSGCIAGVVKNIKFPRVADSGIYPIKYPFVLHPTGT